MDPDLSVSGSEKSIPNAGWGLAKIGIGIRNNDPDPDSGSGLKNRDRDLSFGLGIRKIGIEFRKPGIMPPDPDRDPDTGQL